MLTVVLLATNVLVCPYGIILSIAYIKTKTKLWQQDYYLVDNLLERYYIRKVIIQ
jgi:hypothetical protein